VLSPIMAAHSWVFARLLPVRLLPTPEPAVDAAPVEEVEEIEEVVPPW